MASGSSSGRSAAMRRGQRMLVSFHGSQDIGREVGEGGGPRRGGNLGRNGGHPIEERTEQDFCVEPGQRRVVSPIGQLIKPAQRFPSLELQLHLPPEPVAPQATVGVESVACGGREEQDILGRFERSRGQRRPLVTPERDRSHRYAKASASRQAGRSRANLRLWSILVSTVPERGSIQQRP
jgi:hypothetical protein